VSGTVLEVLTGLQFGAGNEPLEFRGALPQADVAVIAAVCFWRCGRAKHAPRLAGQFFPPGHDRPSSRNEFDGKCSLGVEESPEKRSVTGGAELLRAHSQPASECFRQLSIGGYGRFGEPSRRIDQSVLQNLSIQKAGHLDASNYRTYSFCLDFVFMRSYHHRPGCSFLDSRRRI
jgi:hypothetical protein